MAQNTSAENDKERYGNDEHGQPMGSKCNNHQQCIIHIIQHLLISFQTFTKSHRRSACFAKHGGKPIATRVSTMAAVPTPVSGCTGAPFLPENILSTPAPHVEFFIHTFRKISWITQGAM